MKFPLLTFFILAPSIAALLIAVTPAGVKLTRRLMGVVSGLLVLLSVSTLTGAWGAWSMFSEDVLWLPQLGVHYALAFDGLSGLLLSALFLLMALAMAAGELGQPVEDKGPQVLIALMASGMAGVLLARDLLLFFIFWEVMVIALFLFVDRYGGEGRQRASIQFLVYTAAGSLLMLVAIAGVYVLNAANSPAPLSLEALSETLRLGPVGMWIGAGFLAAFLIKLPMVPLHAWLPDLYRRTPTNALVVAAFMAKLGGYGLLRFLVYPHALILEQMELPLAVIALVGFLYASATALGQRRFTDVLIYASIAHMNLFVLGAVSFTAMGASGSALQLLNQGLLLGITFYLASWLGPELQETAGVGRLTWGRLYLLLGILASLGLPGLNGFAGELLILSGAVQRWPILGATALLGVAIGAIYFILAYRRLAHGHLDRYPPELTVLHRSVLAVPLLASLAIGLAPTLVLQFLGGAETSPTSLLTVLNLAMGTWGTR